MENITGKFFNRNQERGSGQRGDDKESSVANYKNTFDKRGSCRGGVGYGAKVALLGLCILGIVSLSGCLNSRGRNLVTYIGVGAVGSYADQKIRNYVNGEGSQAEERNQEFVARSKFVKEYGKWKNEFHNPDNGLTKVFWTDDPYYPIR